MVVVVRVRGGGGDKREGTNGSWQKNAVGNV